MKLSLGSHSKLIPKKFFKMIWCNIVCVFVIILLIVLIMRFLFLLFNCQNICVNRLWFRLILHLFICLVTDGCRFTAAERIRISSFGWCVTDLYELSYVCFCFSVNVRFVHQPEEPADSAIRPAGNKHAQWQNKQVLKKTLSTTFISSS